MIQFFYPDGGGIHASERSALRLPDLMPKCIQLCLSKAMPIIECSRHARPLHASYPIIQVGFAQTAAARGQFLMAGFEKVASLRVVIKPIMEPIMDTTVAHTPSRLAARPLAPRRAPLGPKGRGQALGPPVAMYFHKKGIEIA